jgi:hypothetical protein
LAILKSKRAAHGRLWLLLRLLDQQGRGWVDLQEARDAFCSTASPLRFCSRRHLRGLLAGGEHLFWSLGRGRVWMRSTARLAKALDVEHFGGRDVSLPVRVLVGGIAQVRAHLYAAFHSGRSGKPIARRTIQYKSGVAPRTQRLYDHHAGLEKRANYALGPQIGSEAAERIAVVQGPAAFVRRGKRGHNGEARRFLAWQLPNSYHGPHAPLGRGRQKRHNGTLVGLLNKGTAGNGQRFRDELPRRFFAQARAAAAAYGRSTETVYWPAPQKGHWHCLWPSGPEMGGGTMQ